MKICARCGKEIDSQMEIFRSTACPHCRADLRTCTNCVFFEKGAHWDCRETISEPVRDKERANFCDYFRFRDSGASRGSGAFRGSTAAGSGKKPAPDAKKDFNKLFGE